MINVVTLVHTSAAEGGPKPEHFVLGMIGLGLFLLIAHIVNDNRR